MYRGEIFFEKKMTASMVPPRSLMTLPRLFVNRHGDKIQEYVTLRNVTNGKMWTVKINVYISRNRPDAYWYQGWKDFAVSHGLVIGDRLTFDLVAKSLFDVYIRRVRVKPEVSVEKQKPWSHDLLAAQGGKKKSPGPQHDCKISAQGCQKTENPPDGTSLETTTYVEDCVANSASDSPASLQRTDSDTDSHYFEPMIQPKDIECVSKSIHNSAVLGENQSSLPHFLKGTTASKAVVRMKPSAIRHDFDNYFEPMIQPKDIKCISRAVNNSAVAW